MRRWRPLLLVALLVAAVVGARAWNLAERFAELEAWIEGLGPLGPLAFLGIYIVAVVLAVPGVAITVLAGALFGAVVGTAVVSVGSTVGAALAFLIARFLARDAVARWLARSARFRKLDALTERHGALLVALVRLVPLFPFNLINYGLGLTRVGFWTYLLWSWLGMLPWTVVFVVGADAVKIALVEGRLSWPLISALVLTVAVLALLVRHARAKLDESGEPQA